MSAWESIRTFAGWGEDGALDAIREYARTIDTISRQIEAVLDPESERRPTRSRAKLSRRRGTFVRGCPPR